MGAQPFNGCSLLCYSSFEMFVLSFAWHTIGHGKGFNEGFTTTYHGCRTTLALLSESIFEGKTRIPMIVFLLHCSNF